MRTYLTLPINADEGFPQAFRLNFNNQTYQMLFYVNADETVLEDADTLLTLPMAHAFMVLRVAREAADGLTVIFQRKLIPNLEYEAAELAFTFSKMVVARQNLNGVGAFGSQVIGGIAAR